MFIETAAFVVVAVAGVSAPGQDWWDAVWSYRQRFFMNASVIDEDLTDFPLGIRVTDTAFLRAHAQPDGGDLRAVDASGKMLDVEIARWANEGIELYVLVPEVAARAPGQYIDLYYGNAAASRQDPGHVWDADYRAVLHLAGDLTDAVTGQPAATVQGKVNVADGAVFDGGEPGYLSIAPERVRGIGDAITIVVRFSMRPEPTLQTLVSGMRQEGPPEWFNFGLKAPQTVHTNATSAGTQAPELNRQGIAPNTWHCAAVRYDARKHTRTLCIDGVVLETDSALPGPLAVNEIRIGRGLLHFDPWQFHGVIDEVHIAGVARSDAWLVAETGCLGERNPFAVIGSPQRCGEPPPPPGTFHLLDPADGAQWRKRAAVALRWLPSAGAEQYAVRVFADAAGSDPVGVFSAGAATQLEFSPGVAPGRTVYWTVEAVSAEGKTLAGEIRGLSFFDWKENVMTSVEEKAHPVLNPARGAQYNLEGYLRGRVDRAIRRYYLETPESSPAILQVLRDRDKTPVREPLVPWAGEFAGKYLTGAQLAWRLARDADLKQTIDQFARDLIACQNEDGYLGPFPKVSRLTGGNWDVWGHYHCMLGLMLYYEDTGYEPALDACKRAADLLFETFGPNGPTLTCDGSGGEMNMAVCHGIVLLYRKTGCPRYLDLAKYIVHEAWNEEGAGHYLESALAGKPLVEFPRHRWESLHDWQALAELYWLTGDDQYRRAFEHIWREGVKGDRHNTGGVTSGEGFQGSPYRLEAIETCCTVAWLAFSIDMLRLTGDARVADEIEWSTFNSALGAIPFSGRACAYNVPMDGTRTFGVELPWQSPKAGPDLNCCAVNANRALGMIGQWALMEDAAGLALNYYGPGMSSGLLPSGARVTLKQTTSYPAEGRVRIEVTLDAPQRFTLKLRIPSWSRETVVQINGETLDRPVPGTYLAVEREWKSDNIVDVALDFRLRAWAGEDTCAGKAAVYRGPILYAYDARYNDVNPDDLPPVDWQTVSLEPQSWEGPIAPWILCTLRDDQGAAFTVCDFSSAGQTGNHYRSWLPAVHLPPSPFHLTRAECHDGAAAFSWEARSGADSWAVLIAPDRSMFEAQRADTSEARAEVTLGSGRHYWTVAAMNPCGECLASNGPWLLEVP